MATREICISDLSGEEGAVNVRIVIDDDWYEVDLTPSEFDALNLDLAPYLTVARSYRPPALNPRVVLETSIADRARVRTWARSEGFELSNRGRIPKHIWAAYVEEMKKRKPKEDR